MWSTFYREFSSQNVDMSKEDLFVYLTRVAASFGHLRDLRDTECLEVLVQYGKVRNFMIRKPC